MDKRKQHKEGGTRKHKQEERGEEKGKTPENLGKTQKGKEVTVTEERNKEEEEGTAHEKKRTPVLSQGNVKKTSALRTR